MYRHILIPTDGSATADKAVAAGIEFAREAKARVTFFTVLPMYPGQSEMLMRRGVSFYELDRRAAELAAQILGAAVERARRAGVEFDTDYERTDPPYRAIIDAARRHGCDAIFMATHGRAGVSALLHTSQTFGVLSHSDIPVMVYH